MNQQLSIKYRPINLDQVMGHEKVIFELRKRTKDHNWPQVMFFAGYSGTGKTTLARIIAKTISCENPDSEGNPCNKCIYCKDINEENFARGVSEYNASNIGIEEMRQIDDLVKTKSLVSRYRIIFIDELQELHSNKKAQKNLLKTLETKQKDTYFILGAMDESKVDASIKNRAVRYVLQAPTDTEIGKALHNVCKSEGIEIDKEKAKLLLSIASYSNGSFRTAISLFERCIHSNIWTPEEMQKELGIVSSDKMINIANLILSGKIEALENEFDIEMIRQLKRLLLLSYKRQLGFTLNEFQKNETGGLYRYAESAISKTLEELNKLQNFVYTTPELIEFILLKCIQQNRRSEQTKFQEKKNQEEKNEQQTRRRRKPTE